MCTACKSKWYFTLKRCFLLDCGNLNKISMYLLKASSSWWLKCVRSPVDGQPTAQINTSETCHRWQKKKHILHLSLCLPFMVSLFCTSPGHPARNTIDPVMCLATKQQRGSWSLIIPVLCSAALKSAERLTGDLVSTQQTHTHFTHTHSCQARAHTSMSAASRFPMLRIQAAPVPSCLLSVPNEEAGLIVYL